MNNNSSSTTTTTTTTTKASASASASASQPIKLPLQPQAELEEQVTQCLEKDLDAALTWEYRRACELIPNIVAEESRVADFLRAEAYQPLRAARRLARYWKTRHALFGERWLLRMTQTGTGTLTPHQMEILRTGFCKIVTTQPSSMAKATPTSTANDGNTTQSGGGAALATTSFTLVLDFSLLPPDEPQIQQAIYFYLMTICACDITVLFIVRSGRRGERIEIKPNLLGCTPSRITQFYVLQAYEACGREHLMDYLGYQQRRFAETVFQKPCGGHMAGHSVADTLTCAAAHGFDSRFVPQDLGGQLGRHSFDDWVRARLTLEDLLGTTLLGPPRLDVARQWHGASSAALASGNSNNSSSSSSSNTPGSSLVASSTNTQKVGLVVQRPKEYLSLTRRPGESQAAFTKRQNACYSRRSYHRGKNEILAAQGTVARYEMLNQRLRRENGRLEQLLAQANRWIEHYNHNNKSSRSSSDNYCGSKVPWKSLAD